MKDQEIFLIFLVLVCAPGMGTFLRVKVPRLP